jgi:hypothetical protein
MQTTIDTKQDIFSILYQNRSHLITLGVRRIGLFGSFVRGEQRNDSEIDKNEFESKEKDLLG